jgi:hypothetical protein
MLNWLKEEHEKNEMRTRRRKIGNTTCKIIPLDFVHRVNYKITFLKLDSVSVFRQK